MNSFKICKLNMGSNLQFRRRVIFFISISKAVGFKGIELDGYTGKQHRKCSGAS
jgi:hypothetical protein